MPPFELPMLLLFYISAAMPRKLICQDALALEDARQSSIEVVRAVSAGVHALVT